MPRKRKAEVLQEEDEDKPAREPSPVAERVSRSSVGIQAEVTMVFDWGGLLETFGSLIAERQELVRRLAEVDNLIKEVIKRGCQ